MTTIIDEDYIYKFLSITEKINLPYIVEGKIPVNDFEIALFPEFAQIHNIEIDDIYIINDKEYLKKIIIIKNLIFKQK